MTEIPKARNHHSRLLTTLQHEHNNPHLFQHLGQSASQEGWCEERDDCRLSVTRSRQEVARNANPKLEGARNLMGLGSPATSFFPDHSGHAHLRCLSSSSTTRLRTTAGGFHSTAWPSARLVSATRHETRPMT